jgi:hypothetical protein
MLPMCQHFFLNTCDPRTHHHENTLFRVLYVKNENPKIMDSKIKPNQLSEDILPKRKKMSEVDIDRWKIAINRAKKHVSDMIEFLTALPLVDDNGRTRRGPEDHIYPNVIDLEFMDIHSTPGLSRRESIEVRMIENGKIRIRHVCLQNEGMLSHIMESFEDDDTSFENILKYIDDRTLWIRLRSIKLCHGPLVTETIELGYWGMNI